MDLELKNKHILVTGGAGGIGQSIVSTLAQEGSNVSLHYRTSEEQALKIQEKNSKEQIFTIYADLTEEADVHKLFRDAIGKFGRIDGLVVNAGIWSPDSALTSELTLERWEKTIKVNLTGSFLCVKEFFINLKNHSDDNGSIVLIGSTAGLFGEAGYADYSATKAALMYGLVKTWKNEIVQYASLGRVNTVAPGWVKTPMAEESLRDKEGFKKILQTIPLKKIAYPVDIAALVTFLLSDKVAGHISGETIMVHGGMEGRLLFDKNEIDL
ncbi:3-oxoacyl-[acyl-carrier-protein] reductase FabG [subsurface metagenome]